HARRMGRDLRRHGRLRDTGPHPGRGRGTPPYAGPRRLRRDRRSSPTRSRTTVLPHAGRGRRATIGRRGDAGGLGVHAGRAVRAPRERCGRMTAVADAGVDEVRVAFQQWLADNAAELAPFKHLSTQVDEVFAALSRLQKLLYSAGWIRLGWPDEVGGLGGPQVLRAVVSEELAAAGYPPPFSFGTQEVLGPAVARFAPPDLAA